MNGKKAAKAGGKGGAKRDSLVVGSKIKAHVKSKGCKSSGDLLDAVNDALYGILDRACERSQSNKRSTVRPQDV
jgi:hypothetical protein